MSPKLLKLVRYVIAGGTATAVNLGTLYILVDFAGVYYLTASIISFIVSTVVSFTLQKFWTFRDQATDRVHHQFAIYLTITLINIGVNTLFMWVMVSLLGLWYLGAQIISALLIALNSFFMYQKFVFVRPNTGSSLPEAE